jgi:hypothetical protein
MKMNKNLHCVIITTINAPSLAIRKYIENPLIDTIIVADTKTPVADYEFLDCIFLSLELQQELAPSLHKLLPLNHYSRKNMGYLYAIKSGYQNIIETDDDNIPLENWSARTLKPESLEGATHYFVNGPKTINIYNFYTDIHIWPRGLPLSRILNKSSQTNLIHCQSPDFFSDVSIIQGLADGDPDVDAIFRLTAIESQSSVFFNDTKAFYALGAGSYCPANTQNTLWRNPLDFHLLYIPSYVSFRFCDILKMYVAQALIRRSGRNIVFQGSTVFQDRNPHDFFKDFLQEYEMYVHVEKLIDLLDQHLENPVDETREIISIYHKLVLQGIIKDPREMSLLKEWLECIA